MRNPIYFATLPLIVSFLSTPFYTNAQTVLPKASDGGGKGVDTKKVYDVVEQMPPMP